MSGASRLVRRGALPALVAAALAFGAAQALAATRDATTGAKSCSEDRCDAICVSHGHAGGDCATGACRCFD
ncbi:hypothetical protein [Longimicrobium sp.]|uniref:hypothetical protein n=1 Tax=Longimicrobium sp. TaxID=2029185 RepID=UPI002C82AEAF|nr:hypothetical protein [Longimicrobium sp.]HSU17205.1 hypothetical protein [Longimicrobium sp.]